MDFDKPRVWNKRNKANCRAEIPHGAVYVGRPTKWGNPFRAGVHGTRVEVIALYRQHLISSPSLYGALGELRGKHLVCWCAPKACHADVLLELANG